MTRDVTWLLVLGLVCVLLGGSYITWGNWLPIGVTMNNPTWAGVYVIVVGSILTAIGLYEAWSDRA